LFDVTPVKKLCWIVRLPTLVSRMGDAKPRAIGARERDDR
jgi:hypothetical protein